MPSTKRILCVSESSDTCFLISNLLRQSDYAVSTASSPGDALRLISAGRFDMYVLGKRYNDQSTINLCRKIRALDRSALIVFYAGDNYQSSRRKALLAGARAYIPEPYLNELLETIEGLFDDRQSAAGG